MSRRARVALSGVCAILAMLLVMAYAKSVRDEADHERSQTLRQYGGDVVALVVARRSIEAGETVGVSDVEERDWVSTLAPDGALVSMADAVGKEISVPVAKNAPLTDINFRDMSQLADIPSGHVAVSVPVTEKLGVPAGIEVGARVVAYRAKEGGAELVSGNAIVLAVPAASASWGKGALTVAVKADEVPPMLSASTSGDLRLVVPAADVKKIADVPKTSANVEPVQGGEGA